MQLPKDILAGTYKKPRFFLCNTDKEKICELITTGTNGTFKLNGLSELSFEVSRFYTDDVTGEVKVNPYYAKIEAFRLVLVDGFGYFELQGPEIIGDGIKEYKLCTAKSLEYSLSTKYLDDFYVNTGEIGSIEVTYAEDVLGDINKIELVTLYNPSNPQLSLLHLVLEKAYGWSIGHVDKSLQTLNRQFEIDRESIYDFLMNEVCEKFNCYIVFDTINNTINIYAESLTAKFIGDGVTNTFVISPPFLDVNTVSVDGYKTTLWSYNNISGELVLEDTPGVGLIVEVVDGSMSEWETDVLVSFENLAQEININYDADSIKTVLNVSYGDGYDIREVNLGLPYLTDLSYYYTEDWMGKDLYDAYTTYMQKNNNAQSEYSENAQKILELQEEIINLKNRLSLVYSMDSSVNPDTVGTYYVISGGEYPNYTYYEVSLPQEYNANKIYYKIDGANVTEDKISTLYSAIRKYFVAIHQQVEPEIKDIATKDGTYEELLQELTETNAFNFVLYEFNALKYALVSSTSSEDATIAVRAFLDVIWNELGATPLEQLFMLPYKEVQSINAEAGYADPKSNYYWFYYPVTIMIDSLNAAIDNRQKEIIALEESVTTYQNSNAEITNGLLVSENFTEEQLVRLNAFLREDELILNDIVETDLDDIKGSFKVKQDAMESGRIELQKLCQPQLQFTMSMANIYALPEFEPIVKQFQLGRVIRVALRPDYIKQSRLMQVNINFDDFSDFSCEFGELTNLRSQSDIHADLLSNAITAGKSVATNSSYWTRGADKATSTDLKIQQGLLDANTQIKAIDGTQGVVIDKYGIKLQKIDQSTGEVDPHQTWMTNNMILMSDDGFKTSRSAIGQLTVEGNEYYGLIAEMMLSGYIEGTKIVGGSIKIGEGENGKPVFEVDESGHVTMHAASIKGYATTDDVNTAIEQKVGSIELSVEDSEDGSVIKLTKNDVEISSGEIKLNGFVTFNSLEDYSTQTIINGADITTGNINGGTIKIGEYTDNGETKYHFEVDEDGSVKMNASNNVIGGYATTDDLNTFSSAVNQELTELQNQIDGSITTWFESGEPSIDGFPAIDWNTTELQNLHLGDLYYDDETGFCYRWQLKNDAYSWARITDSDITKALEDAKKAQDTADGKRRVFTEQPEPPYDVGDLWTGGANGDLKRCKTAKLDGSFDSSDWELATKYTDVTTATNASIAKLKDSISLGVSNGSTSSTISLTVDGTQISSKSISMSGLVSFSSLSTAGSTTINGSNITTGTISADRLDVNNIFAKSVTASGNIQFKNQWYEITNTSGSGTNNVKIYGYNDVELRAGLKLSIVASQGFDVSSTYINMSGTTVTLRATAGTVKISSSASTSIECGTASARAGVYVGTNNNTDLVMIGNKNPAGWAKVYLYGDIYVNDVLLKV